MTESAEMYLETILVLKKKKPQVRSIDLANELNYSKPSISRAVNNLKKEGYIRIDKDGFIDFEEKGLQKANEILERHQILSDFIVSLGVDEITAAADACRIEHVISPKTFAALKEKFEKK